jgi:hypothetical protein
MRRETTAATKMEKQFERDRMSILWRPSASDANRLAKIISKWEAHDRGNAVGNDYFECLPRLNAAHGGGSGSSYFNWLPKNRSRPSDGKSSGLDRSSRPHRGVTHNPDNQRGQASDSKSLPPEEPLMEQEDRGIECTPRH